MDNNNSINNIIAQLSLLSLTDAQKKAMEGIIDEAIKKIDIDSIAKNLTEELIMAVTNNVTDYIDYDSIGGQWSDLIIDYFNQCEISLTRR